MAMANYAQNIRFWFGTVVLTSAFALGVVSVQTMQTLNDRANGSEGITASYEFSDKDFLTPIETRIEQRVQVLEASRDPQRKRTERQRIALLYEQLGQKSENFGRMIHAEAALQKAMSYDPTNPRYSLALAGLYERAAVKTPEPRESASLM